MISILAIDFGNKNCIVAIPKDGSINILNNQASQRLTPTMISFTEFRRYFGVFSQQKQMENITSTITQIKQLIGLNYNSTKRQFIEKSESCTLVPGPTGFTFVKLNFLNKEAVFSVEQCVAFLLKGCFDIAKLNNVFTDQCVIVVPPWWSEIERRVIIDSAKIAGIKVAKLLNSTTAEAITYYMDHQKSILEQQIKYVVFIDFGDSCLNSAVIQFSKGAVEVKSCCFDDNIGGSNFTLALVNYLLKVTKQKYNIDPSTNRRSMVRFTEAAEKLKKGLSVNQVMQFEVDSLSNGASVSFLVKRSEFEDQIQELLNRINIPIVQSIKMANISLNDIFTVEIHGGSSRVPAVKAKIAEIFGRDPTQSVNSDECFATGAGYQAVILSPQTDFNLKVTDVFYHKISIECNEFQDRNHRKDLFQRFQVIPFGKVLTHHVQQKTMIDIICEDKIKLGSIYIRLKRRMEATVQITIRLNQNGIIEVPKIVLVGVQRNDWKRKMNNGTAEFDEDEIDFQYKSMYELHDAIIKDMSQQEKEMEEIDKSEEERDNVRNSLESYIFKLKNALERDSVDFFDPSMIDEYKQLTGEVENWFYENEFERHSAKKYNKILQKLKDIGDPAFKRQKSRENLPLIVNRIIDRAEKCNQSLSKRNIDDVDEANQIKFELDQIVTEVEKMKNELQSIPCYLDMAIDEDYFNNELCRIEKIIQSY